MADNGLYALLDAMARRDQMAESRRDRELRKDQMLLALEEIRGNNEMNRGKLQMEMARTNAMIQLELAKADTDRKRLELDIKGRENEMKVQMAQLRLAERAAKDAHERHKIDINSIENQEARAQALEYSQNIERIDAQVEKAELKRDQAVEKNGAAFGAVTQMFGGVQDGKFKFNEFYRDIYEDYIKAAGLPKGTPPERVAEIWAEEFMREHKASSDKILAQANELRKQRGLAPATALSQLSPVEQRQAMEQGFRNWFTGDNGPLVVAAKADYSPAKLDELVRKFGPNFYNAMRSRYRFTGKSMAKGMIDPTFWDGSDPQMRGNREFTSAVNYIAESYGNTAAQAADDYNSTLSELTNFHNNISVLKRESAVNAALLSQHSLNMQKGRGPLTEGQRDYIQSNVRLQWNAAGLPLEPLNPVSPRDPEPGDGEKTGPFTAKGGGSRPPVRLIPSISVPFSSAWIKGITEFYSQMAVDLNAAADTTKAAVADPANAAAIVTNATGAPNPYTVQPDTTSVGGGGGGVIVPQQQISHLMEAVGGQPVKSMWGSGYAPTRADSMNAEFFATVKGAASGLADSYRNRHQKRSLLRGEVELNMPGFFDRISELLGSGG